MNDYKKMSKVELYNLIENGKTVEERCKASEEWFKRIGKSDRRRLLLIFIVSVLTLLLTGLHTYFVLMR